VTLSIREVYDPATGKRRYTLPDETMYVQYSDYHRPEGCDLYSFSMCGNVYDPSEMTPYRAAFSPASRTLAILYRASNLGYTNRFSVLRLYAADDGALLRQVGSFEKPVETFTYTPDDRVLVGYVDGSIELVDPAQSTSGFTAWHFNAPADQLSYSPDSQFLLLRWGDNLDVRRTVDGALVSRYTAETFAVSPVSNQAALAGQDGSLRLQDIASGKTLYQIAAHAGPIYALSFSPDGQMLVSSGEDCAIRAWQAPTSQALHAFEETTVNAYEFEGTASRIFIYFMRFIPGTDRLVGFGSWGTAVSWNIHSGATNYVIRSAPLDHYNGMVTLNPHFPESFGVDLPNNLMYIGSQGYDITTGQPAGQYQLPAGLEPDCAPTGPVSKDGQLMFTRGDNSRAGEICVLEPASRRLIESFQVLPAASITRRNAGYMAIDWLYLSPDGRQLIVTTLSGVIFVYQITP
jgi:hypothetical protein